MSMIKKTVVIAIALSTLTVSTLTADAGRRERNIALGALGGFVAGAVIADAANRRAYRDDYYVERRVYRPRVSYRSAHVNWCYNRYRSYRARSNTWISYGGRVRACISPYSR